MPKSYPELVAEARAAVAGMGPQDLKALLDEGRRVVVVDVREPQEWHQGVVPGAHLIPRGVLEQQVDRRLPYDETVVVYCAVGNRSALAAKSLKDMGFSNVCNLDGGFMAWAQAGLPVDRR